MRARACGAVLLSCLCAAGQVQALTLPVPEVGIRIAGPVFDVSTGPRILDVDSTFAVGPMAEYLDVAFSVDIVPGASFSRLRILTGSASLALPVTNDVAFTISGLDFGQPFALRPLVQTPDLSVTIDGPTQLSGSFVSDLSTVPLDPSIVPPVTVPTSFGTATLGMGVAFEAAFVPVGTPLAGDPAARPDTLTGDTVPLTLVVAAGTPEEMAQQRTLEVIPFSDDPVGGSTTEPLNVLLSIDLDGGIDGQEVVLVSRGLFPLDVPPEQRGLPVELRFGPLGFDRPLLGITEIDVATSVFLAGIDPDGFRFGMTFGDLLSPARTVLFRGRYDFGDAVVPLPGGLPLLVAGLGCLALLRRRAG